VVVPVVLGHVAQRGRRRPVPPRCASGWGTPWTARPRSGRRAPVAARRACRSRRRRR
jgi:hypothetical protein